MAFAYRYDPAEHREKHCGAQNKASFQRQGSAWIGQCPVNLDKATAETLLRHGIGEWDGAACEHAHYKCYAYVQPERLAPGWSRDRIVEAINAEGVPCFQGSCSEVYLEKAFDGTGWRPAERLPVARELGETSIMFLVHPTLTQAEVDMTCEVVRRVMGVAGQA